MSKKDNMVIVPKYRFPEFRDCGEWEEKILGKIGDPLMCKRIFKDQTIKDSKVGVPFYKIGTFGKEADSFIPMEIYEKYKNKYSFPKNGDILISASGTIGRLVIYDGKPAYFQDSNIVWVENNEKQVINPFLFYCYSNLKWQTSDGGAIKRLYNSNLKNMNIKYPKKIKEQQKIADCLSSVDKLISAEEKKLSLLKDYKKGWMQRLFPKEGKTVPEWRFPEFRDCGEWEEKKIGKFGEIINGLSGKKSTDFGSGEPYIQYKQVFDKSYIDFSECGKVSIKNDEKQNAVQKGDILFTTSSETPDEVGFASVVVNKPHKKTYLNSFCFILRPFDLENTIPTFFSFLFQSSIYRRSVSAIAQGSTRYNLSKVAFRKLKIPIPPKPKEQQKIADFLSNIDELIIRQTDKIEVLKQHKKALMQGLFPAVEEVW